MPGKLEAPGQVGVTTEPGILALRQQRQTGHKFMTQDDCLKCSRPLPPDTSTGLCLFEPFFEIAS